MRYLQILFLLFLSTALRGQLGVDEKLNATLFEAQDLLRIYNSNTQTRKYDCPPKLLKSTSDSLFLFLDEVLLNRSEEKSAFLNVMMQNDCQSYYDCKILDEHYRPIYSKLLGKYANSNIYEALPIALSTSNPGLQISGDRAGIWQLSYVNARRYGLVINELIDERMDVTQSTYAAIQYFMFLETLFPDRPLLILSAFYTSVPYVTKKLSRLSEDTDEAFINVIDADLLNFLIYVDSWKDWMNNFKAPKKADIIAKEQKKWKNVEVKDTVEIQILAEFLGLDLDVLAKMNPVWIGDVLTPDTEEYPFYLPESKADFIKAHYDGFLEFQQEIEDEKMAELLALKKRLENDIPDPSKYMAIDYKVRSGDVLGLIAQRYGVKVSSIKKWNKLSSDRINIGQNLVLYVPKGNKKAVSEEKKEEKVDNKIELVDKEPKPGKGTYTSYIVKDGESLWLIARKFSGVSSENIMEWNGISDKIKPGQTLKIYEAE